MGRATLALIRRSKSTCDVQARRARHSGDSGASLVREGKRRKACGTRGEGGQLESISARLLAAFVYRLGGARPDRKLQDEEQNKKRRKTQGKSIERMQETSMKNDRATNSAEWFLWTSRREVYMNPHHAVLNAESQLVLCVWTLDFHFDNRSARHYGQLHGGLHLRVLHRRCAAECQQDARVRMKRDGVGGKSSVVRQMRRIEYEVRVDV